MSKIDELVNEAYKLIDISSDFQIPKLSKMKVPEGRRLTSCKVCGAPFSVATYASEDKNSTHCAKCKKRVAELYKIRKNKNFSKSTIETTMRV